MRFELGAMSVGDILDRGLKLLLARLPTFYTINFLVLMPVLVLQLISPLLISEQPNNTRFFLSLAFAAIASLLSLILGPVGSAAMLHIIAQEFIDRQVGLGAAFAFAFRRFVQLFAASFLYGLLVFVGGLACCIPGVLFLVWFAFVAQIVVVEGLGPLQSFRRSQDLIAGFGWRFLGVFLLLVGLQMANALVQLMLQRLLPGFELVPIQGGGYEAVLKSFSNHVINTIVAFLLNALAQTYYNICVTLFYFDLRIRKEGYDLELAASQQTGVGP
jgi:hypothetical protein